jgi:ribonuclease HI
VKNISSGENYTTNNRMELTAINNALFYVRKIIENNKNLTFEIYSDSAYCVNAINNKWVENWRMNGWKTQAGDEIKNKDLWYTFWNVYLKTKDNVKFIKVKGHSGNALNELADSIARKEAVDRRVKSYE